VDPESAPFRAFELHLSVDYVSLLVTTAMAKFDAERRRWCTIWVSIHRRRCSKSFETVSPLLELRYSLGWLFAQINGHKNEIVPVSVRDFCFKTFDSQITFVTDSNGRQN